MGLLIIFGPGKTLTGDLVLPETAEPSVTQTIQSKHHLLLCCGDEMAPKMVLMDCEHIWVRS